MSLIERKCIEAPHRRRTADTTIPPTLWPSRRRRATENFYPAYASLEPTVRARASHGSSSTAVVLTLPANITSNNRLRFYSPPRGPSSSLIGYPHSRDAPVLRRFASFRRLGTSALQVPRPDVVTPVFMLDAHLKSEARDRAE